MSGISNVVYNSTILLGATNNTASIIMIVNTPHTNDSLSRVRTTFGSDISCLNFFLRALIFISSFFLSLLCFVYLHEPWYCCGSSSLVCDVDSLDCPLVEEEPEQWCFMLVEPEQWCFMLLQSVDDRPSFADLEKRLIRIGLFFL